MYSVIRGLNQTKSRKWMGVFIMTFLLYYDAGQAAKVADHFEEGGNPRGYFAWLQHVAEVHPSSMKRGTERRHMRGENERKALDKLASFGTEPWDLLQQMYPNSAEVRKAGAHFGLDLPEIPSYTTFYKRMTIKFAGTQFGPYFIWKLYDIFNVCLDMPISLSLAETVKYMPEEPKKAVSHFFPEVPFSAALVNVCAVIAEFDHPVVPGRKCGLAEAETVLCMMKGFFKTKTHVIGDDIIDKYIQLKDHPELQALLPNVTSKTNYTRGDFL